MRDAHSQTIYGYICITEGASGFSFRSSFLTFSLTQLKLVSLFAAGLSECAKLSRRLATTRLSTRSTFALVITTNLSYINSPSRVNFVVRQRVRAHIRRKKKVITSRWSVGTT